MPTQATPISSDLVLVLDNGTGASGQPLSKNRTYNQVKNAATNDDLYEVSQALTGMQSRPVIAIQRRNTVQIEEV